MVKRKLKKDVTSSEPEGNDSEESNEISDSATLSDQPPPPTTPRRSRRNAASQKSRSKKKPSSEVSFTPSPSPEAKSPKKPRSANLKPPGTPTRSFSSKKSKQGSALASKLSKKNKSVIKKEKLVDEDDDQEEDEDDKDDNEEDDEDDDDDDEENDDEEEYDDSDEEEEEDEDEEDEDQDEDKADDEEDDEDEDPELDEESSSEERKPNKKKGREINKKRQKVLDHAIKKAGESKTTGGKDTRKKKSKDTTVYLEDYSKDPIVKREKLKSCKVFDKDLVDCFLTKTYKNLPKLPKGYTNNRYLPAGEGQLPMMYVSELLPNLTKIDKAYLRDLFTFVSDKGTSTLNLSRIEPCDVIAKKPDSGSTYPLVTLRNQKTPALCLSLICADEDYTRKPKDINGMPLKVLTGVLQSMEYERLVTTLCLIFEVDHIKTLMSNNRWSFSSRPGASNNKVQDTRKGTGSSGAGGLKKLSPANVQSAQLNESKWKLGYTSDEDIPILDGRKVLINLPKGLRNLAKTLPTFQEDIPQGSLVLVGYTTLGYHSQRYPDELTIGTNICWAVVLATPTAKVYDYPRSMWHDDPLFCMLGERLPEFL